MANILEKYKSLLENINSCHFIGFYGYRIDKLLCIPIYERLESDVHIGKRKAIMSIILNSFSESYYYDFNTILNSPAILFYSHLHGLRRDYVDFIDIVASCNSKVVKFSGIPLSKTQRTLKVDKCAFRTIVYSLFWNYELRKKKIDGQTREVVLTSLVQMHRWLFALNRNIDILSSIGAAITIFDAREYENLLTQFLNKIGKNTATLQHGHFSRMEYVDEKRYYCAIGFVGFVSKQFWAWGKYAKLDAIDSGLSPECVKTVGCPFYINNQSIAKCVSNIIGLVLDGGDELFDSNIAMLKVVISFSVANNWKIIVKPHPSDDVSAYTSYTKNSNVSFFVGSVSDFCKKIKVAICYNSSVFIQTIANDIPTYRYRSDISYNMYSRLSYGSFSSKEELESLVFCENSDNIVEETKAFLSEPGDVKNHYKSAIDSLIAKNETSD